MDPLLQATAAVAILEIALRLAVLGRHGFHRDELYFVACAQRLAAGYVDHPPLVPWLTALWGAPFGYDLRALRLLPLFAAVGTLLLTAKLVKAFGGGARAVLVAGLAVLVAPSHLRMGSLLCIPVFEPLFWTLASLMLLGLVRRGEASARGWLALGLVVGAGILTKHSMLLWVAGAGVGLLATPHRRLLLSRGPWLALGSAAACAVPNLVWQAQHQFATLTFLRELSAGMLVEVGRGLFLAGVVLYQHPLTLPIAIAGGWTLWKDPVTRPLAIGFLVALAILLATHGKPYYLAPAFPVLLAAGAVRIEEWSRRAATSAAATLGATLPVMALLGMPIVSVERLDRALYPIVGFVIHPRHLTGELHDQYGWAEQVEVASRVNDSLSPDERRVAVVLTGNYGQASAVLHFGAGRGLPPAVSGHMNHFLWGVPAGRGDVAIAYGLPRRTLDELYGDVRDVARIDHPSAWPTERHLPVFVCRAPRTPLRDAWPRLRDFGHRFIGGE